MISRRTPLVLLLFDPVAFQALFWPLQYHYSKSLSAPHLLQEIPPPPSPSYPQGSLSVPVFFNISIYKNKFFDACIFDFLRTLWILISAFDAGTLYVLLMPCLYQYTWCMSSSVVHYVLTWNFQRIKSVYILSIACFPCCFVFAYITNTNFAGHVYLFRRH